MSTTTKAPLMSEKEPIIGARTMVLQSVIANEAEYDQTLAEIQRLLRKGEAHLSPEEERLLDLLSTLAENWEEAHHPIPEAPGSAFHSAVPHGYPPECDRAAFLFQVAGTAGCDECLPPRRPVPRERRRVAI